MTYIMHTDGGARGNPGPAAIGVIIHDEKNNVVFELGQYIGETTNNEAEYAAILHGLTNAAKLRISNIDCFLDSELVVKQLNGEYKVRNENLEKYFKKVKEAAKEIGQVKFIHVKREKNKEADRLVNKALDNQTHG